MNLENLADRSVNLNQTSSQHELFCREFDEGLLGPHALLVEKQLKFITEFSLTEAMHTFNIELSSDHGLLSSFPKALVDGSVNGLDGIQERRLQLDELVKNLRNSKVTSDKFYVNYMDRVFHKLADMTANIYFYQEMELERYKIIFSHYLAYLYFALLKDKLDPLCYDDLMKFNKYIESIRENKHNIA